MIRVMTLSSHRQRFTSQIAGIAIVGLLIFVGGIMGCSDETQKTVENASQTTPTATPLADKPESTAPPEKATSTIVVQPGEDEAAGNELGATIMKFVADLQSESGALRNESRESSNEFMRAGGFQPGSFDSVEDLKTRITLAEEALRISRRQTQYFEGLSSNFKAALEKTDATDAEIKKAMDSLFGQIHLDYVLKERAVDESIFESIVALMKLYEEHWGLWLWDSQAGGTIYDETLSDQTVAEFSRLTNEIQQLAIQQATIQNERKQSMKGTN